MTRSKEASATLRLLAAALSGGAAAAEGARSDAFVAETEHMNEQLRMFEHARMAPVRDGFKGASAQTAEVQVAEALGRAVARELVKEANPFKALGGAMKTLNNFGPTAKGTLQMGAVPRRTLSMGGLPTPKPMGAAALPTPAAPAAMPAMPSAAAPAAKRPWAMPGTGTARLLAADAPVQAAQAAKPGLLTRMSPNARFNAAAKAEGLASPPVPAPPGKTPPAAAGAAPGAVPPSPAPAPGAPASSSRPLLGWKGKAMIGGAMLGTGYAGYKALQTAKDYMMIPSGGGSANWGGGGPQPKAGVNEWGQPQ